MLGARAVGTVQTNEAHDVPPCQRFITSSTHPHFDSISPSFTFCNANPYASGKLMALHPEYFSGSTQALIQEEMSRTRALAKRRGRRAYNGTNGTAETEERLMPADIPSREWRDLEQRIGVMNRLKEADARSLGREQNFIWSFDFMSRFVSDEICAVDNISKL